MKRDHIEAWRDYLVGQMQERYGVANREAQKTVARWLQSLGPRIAASKTQHLPEVAQIKNQLGGKTKKKASKTLSKAV
jgi:hypothetical protein